MSSWLSCFMPRIPGGELYQDLKEVNIHGFKPIGYIISLIALALLLVSLYLVLCLLISPYIISYIFSIAPTKNILIYTYEIFISCGMPWKEGCLILIKFMFPFIMYYLFLDQIFQLILFVLSRLRKNNENINFKHSEIIYFTFGVYSYIPTVLLVCFIIYNIEYRIGISYLSSFWEELIVASKPYNYYRLAIHIMVLFRGLAIYGKIDELKSNGFQEIKNYLLLMTIGLGLLMFYSGSMSVDARLIYGEPFRSDGNLMVQHPVRGDMYKLAEIGNTMYLSKKGYKRVLRCELTESYKVNKCYNESEIPIEEAREQHV